MKKTFIDSNGLVWKMIFEVSSFKGYIHCYNMGKPSLWFDENGEIEIWHNLNGRNKYPTDVFDFAKRISVSFLKMKAFY